MPNDIETEPESSEPMTYQIRIKGQLDAKWHVWFESLTITQQENGDTLLTGLVADQAALHGLLKKIRDLGLTLISICPGRPDNLDLSISKKRSTK